MRSVATVGRGRRLLVVWYCTLWPAGGKERGKVWSLVRGRLIGEVSFVDRKACKLTSCTRCREVDCLPGPDLIP